MRGRVEDRPLRHTPLRQRPHSRRGGPRRAGCLPLDRPGHGAVPGLPGAESPGHALLLREGSSAAHPGREPGGHRDVPPRDELPARHSGPVRALLRRGEHVPPSDLDRPAGAAAAVGSRRGPRRAPIGPRPHEGGRQPGEVRREAAEADRRAAAQRRERPRAAEGGHRDRAGSVRLEGRHTASGERRDRDPGRREDAERGSPGRVQCPGRGPPARGAATAEPLRPGAAHRGRARSSRTR